MKALVPILFTKEVVEAIRILIRMRSSSKISKTLVLEDGTQYKG